MYFVVLCIWCPSHPEGLSGLSRGIASAEYARVHDAEKARQVHTHTLSVTHTHTCDFFDFFEIRVQRVFACGLDAVNLHLYGAVTVRRQKRPNTVAKETD